MERFLGAQKVFEVLDIFFSCLNGVYLEARHLALGPRHSPSCLKEMFLGLVQLGEDVSGGSVIALSPGISRSHLSCLKEVLKGKCN